MAASNPENDEDLPDFHLARDFNLQHLEDHDVGGNGERLVDVIRRLGKLVVKIRRHIPPTSVENVYAETYTRMNGSGRVIWAEEKNKPYECTCPTCEKSVKRETKYSLLIILTSSRVVKNDEEAKHTTCYLDFDKDTEQGTELYGIGLRHINQTTGRCELKVVIHNTDIGNMLHIRLKSYIESTKTFNESFQMTAEQNPKAVIISHPKGKAKRVSIGSVKKMSHQLRLDQKYNTQYFYDTPTTEGCCGAPVYIVGRVNCSSNHSHSGWIERNGEVLKTSVVEWEYDSPNLQYLLNTVEIDGELLLE